MQKRKRDNKDSAVYVDGCLVPEKKLCKELSRQGHLTTKQQLQWAQAPSPRTPKGFLIYTPPANPAKPVNRLLFRELPILQFQDTVGNLAQYLPSSHQSSNALLPMFRGNLQTSAARSIQSVIDAFLPTSAVKEEALGSNLVIERADSMGPAQALNLISFMVSNDLSSESNSDKVYRWLKKQGMAHTIISRTLKGTSADALVEKLFQLAVEAEDVQMVKELLRAGFACLRGNMRLVNELIGAGSQVNDTESGWRGSILVLVIHYWRNTYMGSIWPNLYPGRYSLSEGDDEPPLLKLVKVLIDADAEINPSRPTSINGRGSSLPSGGGFYSLAAETDSPLTAAIKCQFNQVVELLIQNSADVSFRVNGLRSTLREGLQSLRGMDRVLSYSREYGESLSIKPMVLWNGKNDSSSLEHERIIHIARSLINAGVELNDHVPCTEDDCGHDSFECYSVLDLATLTGSVELVDIMISAGAKATRHSLQLAFRAESFITCHRLVEIESPPPKWTISSTDDVLADSILESDRAYILDRQRKRALILMAVYHGRDTYMEALLTSNHDLHIDNPDAWVVLRTALQNCRSSKTWRCLFDKNVLRGNLRSLALNFLLRERLGSGVDDEVVDFLLEAGADVNQPGDPLISIPIRLGNLQLVRKLIQAGSKLETKTPSGCHVQGLGNVLVEAISRSNSAVIEEIIQAGADINCLGGDPLRSARYCECYSPLTMAIKAENWALVYRLRSLRNSVNSRCTDPGEHHCQTPLWAAASGRHWMWARLLINAGAEVNDCRALKKIVKDYKTLKLCVEKLLAGNNLGQNIHSLQGALKLALQKHYLRGAQLIIQSGLVDVNAFSENTKPLYEVLVSTMDNKEHRNHLLCLLLEAGADPNSVVYRFLWNGEYVGKTALEVAIEACDLGSVQTLLRYSASVNKQLEKPVLCFPVQRAAYRGNEEILRVLLERCNDPNAVAPWGQSPHLDLADAYTPDCMRKYYSYRSRDDRPVGTAIQGATNRGRLEMVKMLLDHKAHPDAVTTTIRHTSLQIACRDGNKAIAELLVEYGADVNAPPAEKYGATALQFAAIGGYLGIAYFLLQKGADVNARPAAFEGRTALEGAAEHGRIDMVQMLVNAGADISEEGGQGQWERARKRAIENGRLAMRRLLESFLS
ncbi:ankyrin repeat-containing domain protein [Biscogniauxia mediterranea]|nr:ankyrin repeat-containing domain protein [Biscogniauxia mediterranea]